MVLGQCLLAQHFSYDLDLSQAGIYNSAGNILQKSNSEFYIYGPTLTPGANSWRRMYIALVNDSGQVLNITYYGDTVWKYYPGLRNALFYNYEGDLACVGTRYLGNNPVVSEAYLIIFDDSLSVVSESFYSGASPSGDTSYVFYSGISTYDSGYALVGYKYLASEGFAGLIKLDSIGQVSWNRTYGYGGQHEYHGAAVLQLPDSGFLVSGLTEEAGYYHSSSALVLKAGSSGDLLWYRELGGQFHDGFGLATFINPNLYVVAYQYGTTSLGMAGVRSRIGVTGLDSNGNTKFQKAFIHETSNLGVYESTLHTSGQILICGTKPGTVYTHFSGWVLSINTSGDSLWMREYSHLTGSNSANFLWDIVEGDNGGIIACGELQPHPPDTGPQRSWFIGLDSIGCLQPFCDSTIVGMEKSEKELMLYPNPTSGTFHIVSSIPSRKVSYTVYSSTGKEVAKGQTGPFPGIGYVGLDNLPNGLYLIRLQLPFEVVTRKVILKR
jgi:hypothetical protein